MTNTPAGLHVYNKYYVTYTCDLSEVEMRILGVVSYTCDPAGVEMQIGIIFSIYMRPL